MCSQEVMVMENLRTTGWGGQWEKATRMVSQLGVARYLCWESNLIYNMDLRESPLVIFHGG